METSAKQAFLVDYTTGAVLLSKEADTPVHPSSMSKLMTLYVLFQRIKDGRVALDSTFKVSEKAWRMEGSRSFLPLASEVKVEDLIRGIIIQSGNDACVVVAEGVSGSEEAFAQELNRVGAQMGLKHSRFINSTGWPDDNHLMSASDLATLARRLLEDFPEHYHYFAETSFELNGITQQNRNLLLGDTALGVDGLKTGHTEAGGYGIVLSAKQQASGRRLILVINGTADMEARKTEGDNLLRYGFREFMNSQVLTAGQRVADLAVWFGEKQSVPVSAQADKVITVPHAQKAETKFILTSQLPLPSPLSKGAHVAELKIMVPGQPEQVVPLVASEDVAKLGGFAKLVAVVKHYVLGGEQTAQVAF